MMRREVKIGIAVLSACLLLYLFLAWIRQIHLFAPDSNQYTFRFSNASALLSGDPVTYMGVRVGNVRAIRFSGQYVEVDVSIDKSVSFASDAAPHLMVRELMGGKVIDVWPGKSAAVLPPGGYLTGITDLDFQGAFREAGNVFSAIRPETIDSLLKNMGQLSSDLARMTRGIESGALQKTLSNLNQTACTVNAFMDEIRKENLLSEVNLLMKEVSSLTHGADSALDAITDLSTTLKDSFLPRTEQTLNNVDRSLVKADTLLSRMNEISGLLLADSTFAGAMITNPDWSTRIDSAIHNLNLTLEHLRTKKVHVQLSLSPKQKRFEE